MDKRMQPNSHWNYSDLGLQSASNDLITAGQQGWIVFTHVLSGWEEFERRWYTWALLLGNRLEG